MANLSNINNKFLVTTGGNVGINVTGPTKKIDVYQDTVGLGAADFRHVNGNRILINPSYNYYDAYNHIFRGLNGTDTHMTIDLNGNVGIGATAPARLLTIEDGVGGGDPTDSRTKLYINGSAEAYMSFNVPANQYMGIRYAIAGTNKAFMEFEDPNNYLRIGTVSADSIVFATTNSTKMVILPGGDVGIGTTSPDALLELEKEVNDGLGPDLAIYNKAYNSSSFSRIRMGRHTSRHASIKSISTTAGGRDVDLVFESKRGNGGDDSTFSENMRITSGGNIGINEDNPSTQIHNLQKTNNRAGGFYTQLQGNAYGLSMFVNSGGYGIIGSNGTFTTDVLTMDLNSGNVGIGTDSPQSKLEVATSTNVNNYSDGAVQVVSNSPIAFVGASNLNPSLNRWGFKLREVADGDFNIHDYRQSTTRMRITNSGNVVKPNSCAFSASTTTPGFLVTSTDSKITYNTLNVDTNNNYNTTLSRFTAPVAGNYLIGTTNTCYISSVVTQFMAVYIVKNGVGTSYRFRGGGVDNNVNDWFGISGSVIIPLAQGDYIELFGYTNTGSFQIVNTEGHFYGYLIG